jgi:hypothetical protein
VSSSAKSRCRSRYSAACTAAAAIGVCRAAAAANAFAAAAAATRARRPAAAAPFFSAAAATADLLVGGGAAVAAATAAGTAAALVGVPAALRPSHSYGNEAWAVVVRGGGDERGRDRESKRDFFLKKTAIMTVKESGNEREREQNHHLRITKSSKVNTRDHVCVLCCKSVATVFYNLHRRPWLAASSIF